jgi:hypothetical protein
MAAAAAAMVTTMANLATFLASKLATRVAFAGSFLFLPLDGLSNLLRNELPHSVSREVVLSVLLADHLLFAWVGKGDKGDSIAESLSRLFPFCILFGHPLYL